MEWRGKGVRAFSGLSWPAAQAILTNDIEIRSLRD
jgi:hypothetical protein